MVTSTRSSNKDCDAASGSPEQAAGSKHEIEEKTTSPQSKRAKTSDDKEQKTIEETLNG